MTEKKGENLLWLFTLPLMPFMLLLSLFAAIGVGISSLIFGNSAGHKLAEAHPQTHGMLYLGIAAVIVVALAALMLGL